MVLSVIYSIYFFGIFNPKTWDDSCTKWHILISSRCWPCSGLYGLHHSFDFQYNTYVLPWKPSDFCSAICLNAQFTLKRQPFERGNVRFIWSWPLISIITHFSLLMNLYALAWDMKLYIKKRLNTTLLTPMVHSQGAFIGIQPCQECAELNLSSSTVRGWPWGRGLPVDLGSKQDWISRHFRMHAEYCSVFTPDSK